GSYERNGVSLRVVAKGGYLVAGVGTQDATVFRPAGELAFRAIGDETEALTFHREADRITSLIHRRGTQETVYRRGQPQAEAAAKPVKFEDRPEKPSAARNWPSFRGPHASGVADGQHPPATWDVAKGKNVIWKTPVPG